MAHSTETAAVVALLRQAAGDGHQRLADRLQESGSALALLESDRQDRLFSPDPHRLVAAAQADLAAWQAQGIQAYSVLDAAYPSNLQAVHDRPPLIFVSGRLQPHDRHSVAVIGSRRATVDGLRAGGEIAAHLAALNYTVISGLAAGIDSAVHRAALASGRTLAVLGTGLRRSYPPENHALQRQIAEAGALVSQFWPDAAPSRQTFPQRNVLMSGLALATVIVEASATSGVRIQARAALAHGRPVFLLGTVLRNSWAQTLAQRPNVHVVESAPEIISKLRRLASPTLLTG